MVVGIAVSRCCFDGVVALHISSIRIHGQIQQRSHNSGFSAHESLDKVYLRLFDKE